VVHQKGVHYRTGYHLRSGENIFFRYWNVAVVNSFILYNLTNKLMCGNRELQFRSNLGVSYDKVVQK
jgi:hypothetical protein